MELWYPGSGGPNTAAPDYTFPLTVVDDVYVTLGRFKRPRWAKARDAALAEWAAAGLTFEVVTRQVKVGIGEYPTAELFPPNTLTLLWLKVQSSGGYIEALKAGYATFSDAAVRPLIAHEVGHALGFGHGGNGIMMWSYDPDASNHVNAEERAAAHAYYLEGT